MAAQVDLFTTAAQVIPTMAIVIIVEQALYLPRVSRRKGPSRNSLMMVSVALLVATVGEVFALRALTWTPSQLDVVAVWLCLGWLSFLLAFPVFRELWAALGEGQRDRTQRVVVGATAGLAALASVGGGVIILIVLLVSRR